MFASAKMVDNLIAIIDYNGQQIDGPVGNVLDLGDLKAKFEAFGWTVLVADGNVMKSVVDILNTAKEKSGKTKPVVVLMHTHMGFGVDFMLDNHAWHGSPPSDEQAANALGQLKETLGDY